MTLTSTSESNTVILPSWTVNRPYSTTLDGAAGTAPYTWISTALPTGLTMTTAGLLSGTPTVNGLTDGNTQFPEHAMDRLVEGPGRARRVHPLGVQDEPGPPGDGCTR